MIPLLGATFLGSLILMVLATLMRELLSGRALVPVAAANVATRVTDMAMNNIADSNDTLVTQPNMIRSKPENNHQVSASANVTSAQMITSQLQV
ncbi:MAG: hypothetical protein U5K75_06585 [Ahrensia sp.]|nr:hypothetical protein [Ahrensia sp.]